KYSADEVKRGIALLQKDDNICFEIRYIMDLFVFTKSLFPKATAAMLRSELDGSKVDVFDNGAKVYIVPKMLDKGGAVMRLAHQLGCETLIAAGDSEFDIPMLRSADVAIYPRSLNIGSFSGREMVCPNDQILSEWMLNTVLEQEEDLICS
ncbi:MAG: HAD hydrolase family protein, partial [Clostridia bacterium]|nr:HAD hydrolase family protein [Clostridia bacterium]